MMYALIHSTRGNEETVAVGTRDEMIKRESILRKECRKSDPDGTEIDCYIISEAELNKRAEDTDFWNTLTDEDKQDIIEVDGKRYIRKIYEKNHR